MDWHYLIICHWHDNLHTTFNRLKYSFQFRIRSFVTNSLRLCYYYNKIFLSLLIPPDSLIYDIFYVAIFLLLCLMTRSAKITLIKYIYTKSTLRSIRTLPRVRRNMNNKLAASPSAAAECDSITTGDCILLYYLFGESYVLSHTDSSTIKDICRDISWASTLYSVFKKSNQVTIGKNKKIPGSDCAQGDISWIWSIHT